MKTLFTFFCAFLISAATACAAEIAQIQFFAYDNGTPVKVLEDKRYVICNACPQYSKLTPVVTEIKAPPFSFRFSELPVAQLPNQEMIKEEVKEQVILEKGTQQSRTSPFVFRFSKNPLDPDQKREKVKHESIQGDSKNTETQQIKASP